MRIGRLWKRNLLGICLIDSASTAARIAQFRPLRAVKRPYMTLIAGLGPLESLKDP